MLDLLHPPMLRHVSNVFTFFVLGGESSQKNKHHENIIISTQHEEMCERHDNDPIERKSIQGEQKQGFHQQVDRPPWSLEWVS